MIKSYKQSKSYKYAKAAISGKVIASKFIILQAERYLKDLKRKDLYFDLEWHHKVTVWFDQIMYVPELGKSVSTPPPHAFWIEQIHCLRYKESGLKKYKSAYIQVARKNYKTYYASGNALFELMWGADNRPQIMCGANSREQAIICTDMVGDLILNSPALKEQWHSNNKHPLRTYAYMDLTHKIVYNTDDRRGMIRAMPKKPGDGQNPSIAIVDEFHEAVTMDLFGSMKTGQGQRKEPFIIVITSPGKNKDAPCYSILRKKSVDQLNGTIEDDRHLSIIFELDDESDWDNIDELEKSNPMIPYSDTLKGNLIDLIKDAKNSGGAEEVHIKIKNCGIWVDSAEVWVQHETILKNNHEITIEELEGLECYAGLDLAKKEDLNAFALFFPNVRENIHVLKMMFWIPSDKVNDNRDHVDYRRWVQDGFMIEQDGNVADQSLISVDILNEIQKYDLKSFGFDSRYAYSGIVPFMCNNGYEDMMVGVGQAFTLSGAVVEMQNWMKRYEMDLMHNKVLYWNLSNVVMKMGDHGDMFPSKGQSQNRIDGVSAALTAITEYMRLNAEVETVVPKVILLN